ncbi:MAG TPA: adenylate cyclase regulatory domain-containing protein [Baekduia sp.]|nr:adenylate cyclase regulatory domain-containing protein [Baekduia sp.]
MPDWAALGLLDGLEGPARAERAELLDWLACRGATAEELRRGTEDGLLPFAAAERLVMGGPPTLTLRELAEASGTTVELLSRIRRAQGLPVPDPDERCFNEAEIGDSALLELGLSEEQFIAVSRVLGRGFAQAAQVMRATVLELVLEPGASELELARRYTAAVETVMPHLSPMLDRLLRMHLRNMVRAEGVEAHERAAGAMPGSREVAVAFADLVGFTRLGEEVAPEEVGRVADRLEQLTADVVEPPVRLVKTIGDAAMLVADDPAPLLACTLELVEAVDAEGAGFPQVKVGVACGPAAQRGGDWFGRPVNLASRITSVARAGSVLVASDARVGDGFRFSFAGERRLRGVAEPVKLFRARRDAPDA